MKSTRPRGRVRTVSFDGPVITAPTRHDASDAALLDSYSRTVVGVVEAVSPSVVNVVARGRNQENRPGATGS